MLYYIIYVNIVKLPTSRYCEAIHDFYIFEYINKHVLITMYMNFGIVKSNNSDYNYT